MGRTRNFVMGLIIAAIRAQRRMRVDGLALDLRGADQPRQIRRQDSDRRRRGHHLVGHPLVPFKVYRVSDGTGEMLVISDNSRFPARTPGCASVARSKSSRSLAAARSDFTSGRRALSSCNDKRLREAGGRVGIDPAFRFVQARALVKRSTMSGCGSSRTPLPTSRVHQPAVRAAGHSCAGPPGLRRRSSRSSSSPSASPSARS